MSNEEAIFQLQEDFEAFRETVMERLNYLEQHLPPESLAEYRGLLMRQEIEEIRRGL